MSDLGWSDARVDLLRKLWQDGLSASQIAKQLGGVTRNAVIGKVHRIGLSGRVAPSPPARTILRAPRPPRARRAPPSRRNGVACRPTVAKVQPAQIVDEGPGCATLLTLGAHMCKWPIGDPFLDGFTYCGRPAEGPYCQGHSEVAYRPGKPKPLDRDPEIRRALTRYSS